MSAAELRFENRTWSPQVLHSRRASAPMAVARRLLAWWSVGVLTLDIFITVGAFLLAYWARFTVPDVAGLALGIEEYLRIGLIVALVTTILLASHGLYDEEKAPHWAIRVRSIVSSVSTALVLAVSVSYFLGDQGFSRLWYATSWLFAVGALSLWRGIAHRVYVASRDVVAPSRRILVVGANTLGVELAAELSGVHHVLGFADNGSDLDQLGPFELLGPIAEIQHIVQVYSVDELIIALPANRREQVGRVLAHGFHRRVTVKFLPGLDDLLPHRFDVQQTAGRRYIGFSSAARVSWLKRALDLIAVGLGLLALLPLFAIVALAIRIDSPGPIFTGRSALDGMADVS